MEKHIHIIAALQIGLGIFRLIIAAFIFFILRSVGIFSSDPALSTILTIVANVIMVIFVAVSAPGILAGIGLLKRKEWARILTLIISVLDLVNFPIGTAIGVYCIWALTQNETVALFKDS